MFSKHKCHKWDRNGLEQLNFLTLSMMAKSVRSGVEHNNKTTIPFPNSSFKKFSPCAGCGGGDQDLKRGSSTQF